MPYFYIRGHPHSPPLTRHYVPYLISTFAETMPGPMAPTIECKHLTNRVTRQCALLIYFSDISKLADILFRVFKSRGMQATFVTSSAQTCLMKEQLL